MTERELLARQSARLAPFRERLLRRVMLRERGPTLDLCCGFADVAEDLVARVRGPVIGLDRDAAALRAALPRVPRVLRVQGDARALPFRDGVFDLAVSQVAWLWLGDPAPVAREVRRVLARDGVLVAVGEPDFGGAIEHPTELALAPLWEAALRRAGGEPHIGRFLPGALRDAGFRRVEAEIFGSLAAPEDVARWRVEETEMLAGLPLTDAETARAEAVRSVACRTPTDALVFVPTFGIVAWA